MGAATEALLQIAVDGNQVALVEQRNEHIGNDKVSHNEAQCHLQIAEAFGHHHARHRDEGHARDGRSQHSNGNDKPRGLTTAAQGGGGVTLARGSPRDDKQKNEVANNRGKYNPGSHYFSE